VIEPLQSDDAFLADVQGARGQDGCRLWWLGQSGFLLQWRETQVLLDPYLSDSLTAKYARTDKPHERLTRRVVDPGRLQGIDYITATHGHTDHLDADTLNPLFETNSQACLVYPRAIDELVRERVQRSPRRWVPLNAGESAHGFSAVPAAHDKIDTEVEGNHKCLGFVVHLGPLVVYHSGDTVVYEGLADLLRPLNIDVALLPINGKVGNMGGTDAARLANEIGAGLVIPCHYGMFAFNTADPREQFIPECDRLGQPYRVLQAGERLDLAPEEWA
jgi:L-ascorbate metabolism protein UlaG (beta-lactamase superfamily)